MARINVEKTWWEDPRRGRLIALLGCAFKADGAALSAWQLAQKYWYPKKNLIPIKDWNNSGLPEALFTANLAAKVDGMVFVKGSEQAFEWLFLSAEGGKTSARLRKEKYGSSQPLSEPPLNPPSTGVEPLRTSSSSSFSFSGSSSNSISDSDSARCAETGNETNVSGETGPGAFFTSPGPEYNDVKAAIKQRAIIQNEIIQSLNAGGR